MSPASSSTATRARSSHISMLRPRLEDQLQHEIRLPVCALVPPTPRGLAATPSQSTLCPAAPSPQSCWWSPAGPTGNIRCCCTLAAASSTYRAASIEPEPGKPPLAAVVRLIERYFVEPDAASRAVHLSQAWRGHALSATSFGYHLALPRPSTMAGYNPFRDSTHQCRLVYRKSYIHNGYNCNARGGAASAISPLARMCAVV